MRHYDLPLPWLCSLSFLCRQAEMLSPWDFLSPKNVFVVHRGLKDRRVIQRWVALKFLHFYLDAEAETAHSRFYREFRVLARLDHAGIMRAYGDGTYDGAPYLVLEFLAGRTLKDELAAGRPQRSRLLSRSSCVAAREVDGAGTAPGAIAGQWCLRILDSRHAQSRSEPGRQRHECRAGDTDRLGHRLVDLRVAAR